jgi:hypothetical protein
MRSVKSQLIRSCAIALLFLPFIPNAATAGETQSATLDQGFQSLYNLDFDHAQQQFATYQNLHPDDPMGPVAEASGLLFSELNRAGLLNSRFFDRDAAFTFSPAPKPDANTYQRFESALRRAELLAQPLLATDRNDRNALLALALVNGLRADYSALFEHKYSIALHYTRDATSYARQLLTICQDCYDAYIATGISRYLIGSLSAPLRWILRIGGFSGDKKQGMAELQLVSERGHYLAPYARILLAIAEIRQKNTTRARQLLTELRDQYPGNPLFARELENLNTEQK